MEIVHPKERVITATAVVADAERMVAEANVRVAAAALAEAIRANANADLCQSELQKLLGNA